MNCVPSHLTRIERNITIQSVEKRKALIIHGITRKHLLTEDNYMLYDRDIREPLFDFLEECYGKIRILEEKQMGRSRADLVMVIPGAVVGLEIKSDADTYARLARQVKDYDRYFDYNYAVVGSSHAWHIEERVPGWWGIITVEEADREVDFYVLRAAKTNPQLDWKKKLSLLWRPELTHILEANGLPGYRDRSKQFVIDRIFECVPEELLAGQISEELFERDYTKVDQEMKEYRRYRK